MRFDVEQAFGELRSLVHGAPSVRAFSATCCLAQEVEDHAPGVFTARMLGYARGHMSGWPTRCLTLRVPYAHAHAVRGLAWAPLVRGVELIEGFGDGLSAREYTERVASLGWCDHLRLDQFRVRPDVLLEAVEAGLFDHRRSIELWYMNVGDAVLEEVIWRLAEREETRGLDAVPIAVEQRVGPAGRRVVRVNHARRVASRDACVDEDGSLRSGWMRRRAAMLSE